ncbi:MAG: hypothetical protein H5U40_03165, partial [Polyangiaceae bacterium]|nr:hypothetical protein [Polyangiaceae bacterium]
MLRSIFLVLALSLAAAPVAAQHGEAGHEAAASGADADPHGGEHGHGPGHLADVFKSKDFLAALVNFGLLVLIFGWAVKNKVTPLLVERRRQVVEGLAEAKRLKEEAEAKHKEYSDRLAKLGTELEQIR